MRLNHNLVANVRKLGLFAPGETVLVAVSGGADSVALLDILCRLRDEGLRLVVAHLNHGLRGADSDGDEEFVRGLASGYGIPLAVQRADVQAIARASRLSLEDAGRNARYRFFSEAAGEHGATSIAVAHHLDDQAETVLIRLLRGAGGSGLSAMDSVARGTIKRPLLQVSRAELEEYLKARGLSYRTDASNADTAILRNSIRHELIPFLKRYNPRITHRLAATSEILSSDEELLDQLTDDAYRRLVVRLPDAAQPDAAQPVAAQPAAAQPAAAQPDDAQPAAAQPDAAQPDAAQPDAAQPDAAQPDDAQPDDAQPALPDGVQFDADAVSREPRGLRLRLYRRALLELRGDLKHISFRHLEAIDRLVCSGRASARLKLPGNCFVKRTYGTVQLVPLLEPEAPAWETAVAGEGEYLLPTGARLVIQGMPRPADLDPGSRFAAYLDPDGAPFPWLVRSFLPGDRIRPLGMNGVQKVKELFVNEKVPLDLRRRLPLVMSAGRIVWVSGVRLSDEARVKPATGTVLRVEIPDFTP